MQSLIGTWQLVQTECIGKDGAALPAPYGGGDTGMGLLSLREDGRLICVLCDSRKEAPADQSREYTSYCGSYQIDGNHLITRVDATANPAFFGTDQIRDITFEDEVLVLRPIKNTGPISDGQRVLRWTRLVDA